MIGPLTNQQLAKVLGLIEARFSRDFAAALIATFAERDCEIERLKSGRLTPDEFNELCHDMVERDGQPLTWNEHEHECFKHRCKLYGFDPTKAVPCNAIEEVKRQIHEEAMLPIHGDRIVDGN